MGKVKQQEILTDEEIELMMLEPQMVVQDITSDEGFIDEDLPEDDYLTLGDTF